MMTPSFDDILGAYELWQSEGYDITITLSLNSISVSAVKGAFSNTQSKPSLIISKTAYDTEMADIISQLESAIDVDRA